MHRDNIWLWAKSTRGTYRWLWCLVAPQPLLCSSTNLVFFWHVAVFVVTLVLGATEIAARGKLAADDAGRYGDNVFFLLDISYVTWLAVVVSSLIAATYAFINIGETDAYIRNVESRDMSAWAKLHRVAYAFALTSSAVNVTLYGVFCSTNHAHQHTTALFAMNFVLMVITHLVTCMHVEMEHFVWVLAVGLVYAFPVSLVCYFASTATAAPRPYVYSVVDWSSPGITLLNILGVSVIAAVFHFVFHIISTLKVSKEEYSVYQTVAPPETEAGSNV